MSDSEYRIAPDMSDRIVEIDSSGKFTLTEAAQFALAILQTVQTYGNVWVTPK